jgi:hypothetical protein
MEAGPPMALYRRGHQTTLRCWFGNELVLSGKGKGAKEVSGTNKVDERK